MEALGDAPGDVLRVIVEFVGRRWRRLWSRG